MDDPFFSELGGKGGRLKSLGRLMYSLAYNIDKKIVRSGFRFSCVL